MKCQKIKELIPLFMDNEVSDAEKKMIRQHLAECETCRQELQEFHQLEEVLKKMSFKKASNDIWEGYWNSIYNKLERKIGWIFLSIGAIILVGAGIYHLVKDLIHSTDIPLIAKIGIISGGMGIAILLVSIFREMLFARKKERYKEIEK